MTPPPLTPQVTTVKGLDDWATRDFSKNAAAAVKYAEMRDRANAKSTRASRRARSARAH